MSNPFKERLAKGDTQIGLWLSLASPYVADAMSRLNYDWLMCDTEHAPMEVSGVLPILQAAGARTHVVVRAAWNDKVLIKRHLDQGASTILIPFVENADEAHAAVAATRYPPEGIRGVAGGTRASAFGTDPEYITRSNDEVCVIVQLETRTSLTRIEEIAGVNGVDGIFFGPSDLAASLGHLGAPNHPDVQAAIKRGLEQVKSLGKPAGTLATTLTDAQRYLDWGFDFVAVGVDLGLLVGAAKTRLSDLKKTAV